jgi:hypothetical protein
VRSLEKFVPELTTKPSKTESNLKKIREVINSDVIKLWDKYYGLLGNELREKIEKNLKDIAPDELISKYKEIYEEFMKEEEKNAPKTGETNAVQSESYQKIVYELLIIGLKVAEMFKKSEERKQQALAYQQFAINLTIHSNLIGHTKHDIPAIAQKWPMHLEMVP